ncbi:MAG: signal peptidase II [bacterium]|nr:signal peptidase II [bacterium]MCP4965103.1 signal peptidase II [bacterium]
MNEQLEPRAAFRLAVTVTTVLLLVDQLSKNWARDTLQDGPVSVIGDWLQFTYAENPGAAFSSFVGSGRLIGVIGIGITGFLLYLISRTTRRVELVALGLILGGALGNLTDRVFRGEGVLDGAVVDWIDWWFIPTFNIADAALNVGVALLLLVTLFAGSRDE